MPPSHQQLPSSVHNKLVKLYRAERFGELELLLLGLSKRYSKTALVWKLLGMALLGQGKNALTALQTAIALDRHDFEIHNLLGLALMAQDLFDKALPAFDRSLQLAPSYAEAHHNKGLAFKNLEKPEQAIQSFQKAVACNPRSAMAHANLGLSLHEQRRYDLANQNYRRALEIDPSYIDASGNLGRLLLETGDLSGAYVELTRTTRLLLGWLQSNTTRSAPVLSAAQRNKIKMPPDAAMKTLDQFRNCMEKTDIPWCLYAGTALGVYRDSSLIPGDKDMDVALPASVPRQTVIRLLAAGGGFALNPQETLPEAQRYKYFASFLNTQHQVSLDVFFLHPDGDGHFVAGVDHAAGPVLCRLRHFEFGLRRWRDKDWPLPAPIETYLEDVYGSSWRIPDPDFDTVLSNPSRIAESIPVVLCFGYARLNTCLSERKWRKALSYCRQLRARQPDVLLDELEDWLNKEIKRT